MSSDADPGPPTPSSSKSWRALRALLITLSIALGLINGFPVADANGLARLPPALRGIAARLPEVQAALLLPFHFISDPWQLSQRWTLFSTTGGIRYRLWVEARSGHRQAWQLLYRAQDPAHAFLADTLGYRRIRNAWNPNRRGIKPSYAPFTVWLSRSIFLREPQIDEVRIRQERVQILDHGAGIQPLGEFENEIIHRRREVPL